MKANVLYGINDLRFVEFPLPKMGEKDVLVKVKASGICGSDIARVFKTGTYHFPTIIGHEFSGIVADKGNALEDNIINKRVAIYPLIPCFKCKQCKEGNYQLCSHYNYLGSRTDGGFAQYVAVPMWNLLELPNNVTYQSAAMIEPASVALHAYKRSNAKIGDKIIIIGPGTIGMILAKIAILSGASKVVLIGRSQNKLDFAEKIIPIVTINSTVKNYEKYKNDLSKEDFDVAFEGTGASKSLSDCIDLIRPSGTVVTLGNPINKIDLDKEVYWKILRKEISIKGTWNSSYGTSHSDWKVIISMLSKRQLELEDLITQQYKLADLNKGLKAMIDSSIYTNKVMIVNE